MAEDKFTDFNEPKSSEVDPGALSVEHLRRPIKLAEAARGSSILEDQAKVVGRDVVAGNRNTHAS